MRTAVLATTKLLVAGLLVAAALDVPIPGGRRPRTRIYLYDRTASVRVPGDPESLTPIDAWRLLASDARRFDRVIVIDAAERPRILHDGAPAALPAAPPDGGGAAETDLAAAIRSALARGPEEADIVLLGDGRPTRPGTRNALVACAARGFPVHVVPVGPVSPRDVRIARLEAPAFAGPREAVVVEVDLVSGTDGEAAVKLETEQRVTLVRGVPRRVRFELPPVTTRREVAVEVRAVDFEDACPENNTARWTVQPRTDKRRLLVFAPGASSIADLLRAQPDHEVVVSAAFVDPSEFHAVVFDGLPARAFTHEQQRTLKFFVESGRGLAMMGGPTSFGPGGWAGTPVEEVLPVWAFPDERLAVAFVLDRSGSMNEEPRGSRRRKVEAAAGAIERCLEEFRTPDRAALLVTPPRDGQTVLCPLTADRDRFAGVLRGVRAEGQTALLAPVREAARLLENADAPRRQILLLTDGQTAASETAGEFAGLREELANRKIGLSLVLTGDAPSLAVLSLASPVSVTDWEKLSALLADLLRESRDPVAAPKAPLRAASVSEITKGLTDWPVPRRINRVSLKQAAELLLLCDDQPAVALRTVRSGHTLAVMFSLDRDWAGGVAQWPQLGAFLLRLLDKLIPGKTSPYVLSCSWEGTELALSARGPQDGPAELAVEYRTPSAGTHGTAVLRQISPTGWEARIPLPPPGTTYFELKELTGQILTFHLPYAAEFAEPGVDFDALREAAAMTGGVFVRRPEDLRAGPEPGRSRRSGRPYFLVAALVLFLLDLGISTFWVRK